MENVSSQSKPPESTTRKQAVVLIHGIGEQVPMDTLRGFVRAVWSTDESVRNPYVPDEVWSKPDNASKNYELRRLTTAEGKSGKRTDFFEFYWADLMEGTEVEHVRAWLKLLLFRSPAKVPAQLRGLWWIVVLTFVAVASFAIVWWLGLLPGKTASIVSLLTIVLPALVLGPIRKVAGDAARYLHVAPLNIGRRREIRNAGIELIQGLHDSGDYDRIVLVGHSLGTVIGYDVLTHLWPRFNTKGMGTSEPDILPIEEVASNSKLNSSDYQAGQSRYAESLKNQGCPWIVTDFVTMGSPLAHAPYLLTRQFEEFDRKIAERELPTCPPTLEKVRNKSRFSYPHNGAWFPNHAAVFGPTRWTNLYFPCRATVFGDVVGGPLCPHFGKGIKDVAVTTTINGSIFNHTHYWQFPSEIANTPKHIEALRNAIKL